MKRAQSTIPSAAPGRLAGVFPSLLSGLFSGLIPALLGGWGMICPTAQMLANTVHDETPLEARVPHMATGEAQLSHARRVKARALRAKGERDREFWRTLAIEAYQAVRVYHPGERKLGAEGAFRAGEMLRAAGRLDSARAEFQEAARRGKGTPFRSRARLELGHLERRAADWRAALEHYLEVASDSTSAVRHREEAWLWAGRMWWEQGSHSEARRAWRGVCERLEDPFLALRAHDELTLAWVEVGDLEAAAGQLLDCKNSLSAILLEETERGERLCSAFQRMRGRKALRSAIEREQERDNNSTREQIRFKHSQGSTEKPLTPGGECFIGEHEPHGSKTHGRPMTDPKLVTRSRVARRGRAEGPLLETTSPRSHRLV